MIIVFLGPQGSGKGTQAALLAKRLHISTLSTGALYRLEIKNKTALGRTVQKLIDKGLLAPDEFTNALMRKHLTASTRRRGVILDGYPRNIAQARALDAIESPRAVILVTIPVAESVRRIAGRARIEGRADDTPAAVRRRLAIYRKQTEPVVNHYEKMGVLVRVNGNQSIQAVQKDILKYAGSLQHNKKP